MSRAATGTVTLVVNPAVTPRAVGELRASVGWRGLASDYPAALAGYWATVGGFDAAGKLVAWCAILSDGVRHAVLIDVIVHPSVQRCGVGRALVARAIEHITSWGITIVHVDFTPENAAFYRRCGFQIGLGGIYTTAASEATAGDCHWCSASRAHAARGTT